MRADIAIYYLEMTDPGQLLPLRAPAEGLELKQAEVPSPELNRYLYTAVGGDWYWVDRLCWTHEDWLDWVSRPRYETWVAYLRGTPAGYFELDATEAGEVEIAQIGLLPQFVGKGLGGGLLTLATERAWGIGASRVWLHTCSLDHPMALKNYQARGFRVYDQGTYQADLPEKSPGSWPGARP